MWTDTNKYRRSNLTVQIRENGTTVSTKVYDIRDGFTSTSVSEKFSESSGGGLEIAYPQLTDQEFSRLTDSAYQIRLSAFISAVTATIRGEYPNLEGSILFMNEAYYTVSVVTPDIISDVAIISLNASGKSEVVINAIREWTTDKIVAWDDESGDEIAVSSDKEIGESGNIITVAEGQSTLTITYTSNNTGVQRTKEISLKTGGVESIPITIIQGVSV